MNQSHCNEERQPLKVILCGACMAGNMGGPALNIAMIESLQKRVGQVDVTLLSKYPSDDLQPCNDLNWKMIAFPTTVQLFGGIPFSLAYLILRLLGLPRKWIARGPFQAYVDNDLMIDLSGISFTDDRPFTGLIINSLWLLPAYATNIVWIKASQAMGPFSQFPVRLLARILLSHASALIARGAESEKYVRQLLPKANVYELPDVAFLLSPADKQSVDSALGKLGVDRETPYCVVGPSWVVDQRVARQSGAGAYPVLIAKIVDRLVELSGHDVLLIPHERANAGVSYDDLHVCTATYNLVTRKNRVKVLEDKCPADVLKGIISLAEVAVGSRFHFMVAAMSSAVPGLAITWSHKYIEMMRMVEQDRFAIGDTQLNEDSLMARLDELWHDRTGIRDQIEARLPSVLKSAQANADIALDVLRKQKNR